MPLTSQRGAQIREDGAGVLEAAVCTRHGLKQRGGSRTKIDGENITERKSIKNASGASTQVHITTQRHFAEVMNMPQDQRDWLHLFCGGTDVSNNGTDRYTLKELNDTDTDQFIDWMNANKQAIVELIVSNGCDITSVVYNHKTKGEFELTTDRIMSIIDTCQWERGSRGGSLVLRTPDNKTVFHLQREGKKRPTNRYNTLFHIHLALFAC